MYLLGIATGLHHFSPLKKISWLRPCCCWSIKLVTNLR